MKTRVVIAVFFWFLFVGCAAKSKEASVETPGSDEKPAEEPAVTVESEKTEYAIETSAEIVEIDTLPYDPKDNTSLAFFLRNDPHDMRERAKFFVFEDTVYRVYTPHPARDSPPYTYFDDAAFLEIGESMLKIQEGLNSAPDIFTAYGRMSLDDWDTVLKTRDNKSGIDDTCSSRGEKYTIICYNNGLIQVENTTGKAVKYIPVDSGPFRRNYCFKNGYILFGSVYDKNEETETPDRIWFRIYNENLDYIDFDASGDLPKNIVPPATRSFPFILISHVIAGNKPGVSILYWNDNWSLAVCCAL
jgi:hypothetical protein